MFRGVEAMPLSPPEESVEAKEDFPPMEFELQIIACLDLK